MAVSARVRLDPMANAEIARVLSSLSPKKNKAINRKALRIAALLVQKISTEQYIVRGRGRHALPLTDRLSIRTGTLTRSISTIVADDLATIGTDLIYGPVHELGPNARPFLAPALGDAEPKFDEIYAEVLTEQLRAA